MSELYFDEDQLGNLQAVGAALFEGDASDPRSWLYKRQLIRPKIRWWRIALFAVSLVLGAVGVYWLLTALSVSAAIALWVSIGFALVIIALFLKRILICLVRIYQRFAPERVRNKCRFEPSCSQYMILSLQKYGLWKGLPKGIHRLKRCSTEDGGFDEP